MEKNMVKTKEATRELAWDIINAITNDIADRVGVGDEWNQLNMGEVHEIHRVWLNLIIDRIERAEKPTRDQVAEAAKELAKSIANNDPWSAVVGIGADRLILYMPKNPIERMESYHFDGIDIPVEYVITGKPRPVGLWP